MGGALICYSSFIQPTYKDVVSKRSSLSNRINLVDENKAVIQKTQNLLNEYKNSEQLSSTVSAILPSSPDVSQALNQLNSLARINNLNLDTVTTELMAIRPSSINQTIVKGVGVMRIDFRLTGSYENFKAFMQSLETNLNLMEPVNIRVNPGSNNKISYTLTIETYYQAQ